MPSTVAIFSSVLLLATEAFASCGYGTSLHPRSDGTVEVNSFSYVGVTGPLNWHSLDLPANVLCATGRTQSPIDMVDGQFSLVPANALNIQIPDFVDGAEFENLGTTVEVIAQGGNMTLNNVEFGLQQFHFHLPSEHLESGVSHAMEMHMVFESAQGGLAVIGVYIDIENTDIAAESVVVADPAPGSKAEGNTTVIARKRSARMAARGEPISTPVAEQIGTKGATTMLETVFSSVNTISQPGTVTRTQPLVMSEVVGLINAGNLQNYAGSLTTPPCSEGVAWLVSTQKLQVTAASFGRVRNVIGFNSRFPQNQLGQPNIIAIGGAQGNCTVR